MWGPCPARVRRRAGRMRVEGSWCLIGDRVVIKGSGRMDCSTGLARTRIKMVLLMKEGGRKD